MITRIRTHTVVADDDANDVDVVDPTTVVGVVAFVADVGAGATAVVVVGAATSSAFRSFCFIRCYS